MLKNMEEAKKKQTTNFNINFNFLHLNFHISLFYCISISSSRFFGLGINEKSF